MRFLISILMIALLSLASCLSVSARPGEPIEKVLQRYGLEGAQPYSQGDYLSYKVTNTKFISQPTLFVKLGAKNIVLEQNFLFDKNTVHEKDVSRTKNDSKPTVAILHQAYLVGDFSQLPRERFDTRSKVVGALAAPLGAAVGTIAGGGKGVYEGTKIGVKTAQSASTALGGDASGKASAWASSTAAVATGAVTGLFGGFTGGAVEGSVRGARVALEGIHGADMEITEAVPVASPYVVIGGRIGKELTPEEQKELLNNLATLEQSRLANEGLGAGEDLANATDELGSDSKSKTSYLPPFDSAKDRSSFESSSDYLPEDAENKNVAGMW
ncbi:MAG: hypothetical protein HYR97_06675 [Candidatus Melainabacteria bacterium]|nr:hypothetical protein [Candidatus Melainabacteria bacterium]MBI3307796.1 hypothetical protein [Candidatus Melainabacteria bacterium]